MTSAGIPIEQTIYYGFDHVKEHKKLKEGSTTEYNTTQSSYDPLDRTAAKTEKAGTAEAKTTDFDYLGLSGEVITESVAGEIQKSYLYSPWGKRLSQIRKGTSGEEISYYGYNPHTDVEMLYDENGGIRGTYGYTAYGKNDEDLFTGVDKPDPGNPDKEPYNVYRYSAKRWDQSSQSYDMGFRDYSPGLNRFLSLDMYNGALQDMGLSTSPWTNNRYGFAGGNPISNIEWDGHVPLADGVYQTAPVSDYNRAISVGENLYGTSIKKDAWYDTRRASEAWLDSALKSGSTVRQIASFATGFTPVVGEGQDLTILFAGYDPVSGEEISNWYGLAVVFPFVNGVMLRGAAKGVDEIGEGFEVLSRRWSNGGVKGTNKLVAVVNPSKYDYLFGRVTTGSKHNIMRSRQNALQMKRLGVPDTPEGYQMLQNHFNNAVNNSNNVTKTWANKYGTFEERESLFAGPSGQFALFKTSWEVMSDNSRRLTTVIPIGGR